MAQTAMQLKFDYVFLRISAEDENTFSNMFHEHMLCD